MRRLVLAVALAIVFLSGGISTSQGGVVYQGEYVSLFWENSSPAQYVEPGGAFLGKVYSDLNPSGGQVDTIYTFCLELNQGIWVSDPTLAPPDNDIRYKVAGLGNTTSEGKTLNLNGFGAWLFYEFSTGKNGAGGAGVIPTYGFLTTQQAGAIQFGLWKDLGYTNDEISAAVAGYSGWGTTDLTAYQAILNDWQDDYNADRAFQTASIPLVRVAQMQGPYGFEQYGFDPGPAQDLGVLVTGSELGGRPPIVPEPTSIVVWTLAAGLGAAGSVAARRRRTRWSEDSRRAILGIIEGGRDR